jgi:pimeloyl-ACP methyl ester carboxylesterase
MDFNSDTVVVEGLRLHYLRQGEGRPILLLHGWPTHSFIWRNLMPALSELGAVYALDLPGFGASDKPLDGDYTFTWFSRVVEGFIDVLGLDGITIIGHDIGGPTGVLWAIRNPSKVSTAVIMSAPIYPWRTRRDRLSQMLLRTPIIGPLLVSRPGLSLLLRTNVVNKSSMSPDVIGCYQAPFCTFHQRRLLLRTILIPLQFGQKHELVPLAEQIARLPVPVAIIYGLADRLCGRHMEVLANHHPDAFVVRLPNCGHFVQEDCPEELRAALIDFLRGVPDKEPARRLS